MIVSYLIVAWTYSSLYPICIVVRFPCSKSSYYNSIILSVCLILFEISTCKKSLAYADVIYFLDLKIKFEVSIASC
jgi:hypothetical protein